MLVAHQHYYGRLVILTPISIISDIPRGTDRVFKERGGSIYLLESKKCAKSDHENVTLRAYGIPLKIIKSM